MGNIPHTDIYEGVNFCEDVTKLKNLNCRALINILKFILNQAREIEGVKIIRYESSVYYANVENFIYKITKLSGVNPHETIAKIAKKKKEYETKIKKLDNKKVNLHKDFF